MPSAGQQSPHRLVEFFTAVGRHEDATSAMTAAAELASEEFDAEVGAVIVGDALRAAVGFGVAPVPVDVLTERRWGTSVVELEGVGPCHLAAASWEAGEAGRLIVGRLDVDFSPDERNLLMGMARGLGLTLRMIGALETERSLRASLEQRQSLLEVLLDIQRSISHRAPLREVLAAVTAGASALLGGCAVSLILDDALDPQRPIVASSAAADGDSAPGDTIRAPVHVNLEPAGALVATARPGAPLGEAERSLLGAFAEHASLALTDAHTVETMQEAFHDPLTGLPNRALFVDRLEHALAVASRQGSGLTVLFVDLDRFKAVNDSLGHAAGDELLRAVAARLVTSTRLADTTARFGGDEFAVLLERPGPLAGAADIAERIIADISRPFEIQGKVVSIGATVGVAYADADSHNGDELLRNADLAMYRAKKHGGGRCAVYDPVMRAELLERVELDADLQRALRCDELSVHYQPVVDLVSGRPIAIEALARWTHPVKGPVEPTLFIPVAEEIGAIGEIGRLVLRDGCAALAGWRTQAPWLRLNVNVSAYQLRDDAIVGDVEQALRANGLSGEALTVEITESTLMDAQPDMLRRLGQLRDLGVSIALDDFGTGVSALRYLRQVSVDILKIDKSFVDVVASSSRHSALALAIIDFGRTMELQTVAEGIEHADQLEELRALGCVLGQGFHLARPVPAAELTEYLDTALSSMSL